jgi:hypothetical protein
MKPQKIARDALAELNKFNRSEPLIGNLVSITEDGFLIIQDETGTEYSCLWLDSGGGDIAELKVGDRVLALILNPEQPGIVLGRISTYPPKATRSRITIEATESLTLKCGDASVELRADGKAMVKGDDVLIRAKGTQRIRAGTVSIN